MSGFFVAPEAIVEELGPSAAILYGRVWRYCLAERGRCFATVDTLAAECHVGRRTVTRQLSELVEHGYLEREVTAGQPTVYTTTAKYVHGEGSRQNGAGRRQIGMGSRQIGTGVEPNWPAPQAKMAQGSRQNGAQKIRVKNKTEEEGGRSTSAEPSPPEESPPPQKQGRARDLHFEALAEICGLQTQRLTKGNRALLGKGASGLRQDGATPELILACGETWYSEKFGWKERASVAPPSVAQAIEWVGQRLMAIQARQERAASAARVPRPYLMPGGRGLKPITSLMGRPEFEGAQPGDPSTYPAEYLEAARELGVRCG